jgi:hypothetical protein
VPSAVQSADKRYQSCVLSSITGQIGHSGAGFLSSRMIPGETPRIGTKNCRLLFSGLGKRVFSLLPNADLKYGGLASFFRMDTRLALIVDIAHIKPLNLCVFFVSKSTSEHPAAKCKFGWTSTGENSPT